MNGFGRLFTVSNSNIKISNLTIKNTNETAIKSNNSNLTTTHVNFENNNDINSCAIYIEKSNYNSIFDSFTNLKNDKGSAIQVSNNSKIILRNAMFNIDQLQTWGSVYISDSVAIITNTTFANMQSKYSTAIYNYNSTLNISNCSFINLTAEETAGAIGIKDISDSILIDNCKFINVSSTKNAGALFADINGKNDIQQGKLFIKDSLFDNCKSDFGGAILQLGGDLTINNSNLSNNHAYILGGAVYTSNTDLTIINSTFNNNSVPQEDEDYNQGGALYFDKGTLEINHSRFEDNKAFEGSDAYLYDANYEISNSYFAGNIYSMFDDYSTVLKNNTFLGKNSFNNTEYIYIYESNGSSINYNPILFDESLVNATSFDLRDYGLVSPVKNQGNTASCWTFGTTGALESAYLKASNKTALLDISEASIRNSGLMYSMYGIKNIIEGSLAKVGTSYMLSWLGVTTSDDNSFDELGKISPIIDNGTKYHIHNAVIMQPLSDISENQRIKEALVKYGAICVSVHATRTPDSTYNEKTYSSYTFNETLYEGTNHAVTVVGWNDSFSRYNFKTTPPGDGAWIIKNSWGSNWGDNGYYYISYYDISFAREKNIIAYIIDNNQTYEKNYQYDIITSLHFSDYETETPYLNKYVSIGKDLIAAVGTYFNDSGVKYKINIYVNDQLVHTQDGISKYPGFETIKLNKTIGIKENDTFIIEMIAGSKIPMTEHSRQHHEKNTSFYRINGETKDISEFNEAVCLKAYTIPDNSYMTVEHEQNVVKVKYYDENAKPLSNAQVSIISNGYNYTVTTDDEGIGTFNLSLPEGNHTATVINPINGEQMNITLTIPTNNNTDDTNDDDGDQVKDYKNTKHVRNNKNMKTVQKTYKVTVKDNVILEGRYFTIQTLNEIFGQNFINGHLIVYIDGKVVFNDTVDDNIYTIIFEIIESLLGNHELKVEFTVDNNTKTYTENITIT